MPDNGEHSYLEQRQLVHFGLAVSDLDRMVAFFVDFLGFGLERRLAPHDPGAVAGILGVSDADIREIAYLHKKDWAVELLEFANVVQHRERSPTDPGYFHLLVECESFDATVTAAGAHGFEAVAPPYLIAAGPNEGKHGTYLRHGDGFSLEVIGS
ncbi:MAG: VOC family protein [Pacificimonas sp.]|nr:VOC family protein [Pacificimonas sp.]